MNGTWIAALAAVIALGAFGLAAFAVARMSRTAPMKAAIVIAALTGFIAAVPPLITALRG
ncbi:hypothetical protein ACFCX4_01345 [Kitasatospora sp. NPDC056327]|uniref:hypothetical protein n=1 Tax=Kitasatospora sp. NPDC056327 TaxID=3345785 RepID=UPI0035E085C9